MLPNTPIVILPVNPTDQNQGTQLLGINQE